MSSAKRRRRKPSRTGDVRAKSAASLEAFLAAAAAADPKCLPLCAQVRRALDLAIAGACRDEAFSELTVLDVWPDPTTRRLRVWVGGPARMSESERAHVLRRLGAARGFLRVHVAQAIHRKRTPELVFEFVPRARGGEGESS